MTAVLGNGTVTFGNASVQTIAYNANTNFGLQGTISGLTVAGHGCIGMLYKGKLIVAHGNNTWYSDGPGLGNSGLGIAPTGVLKGLQPVAFPNETTATIVDFTIAAGVSYALFSNNNLYTWGNNNHGSCGVGHTNNIYTPILAATGVTNVYPCKNAGVAVEDPRLFIRKTNGSIWACGYGGKGQLGTGDLNDRNSFTEITSLGTTVTAVWPIGFTYGTTWFTKSDGSIWACGDNAYGQLGTGNATLYNSPVDVTAAWGGGVGKVVTKITGGVESAHSTVMMLITTGVIGSVKTCGNNLWGSLGDTTLTNRSTPLVPTGLSGVNIRDIAAFGGGPCTMQALSTANNLYVWGYNNFGQVGDGTNTNRSTPLLLRSDIETLFSDGFDAHTYSHYATSFIKTTSGKLLVTGYNSSGQCGIGTNSDRNTYTPVLLPSDVVVTDMGHFTTADNGPIFVASTADNRLYAWGYNGNVGLDSHTYNYVLVPAVCSLPLGM